MLKFIEPASIALSIITLMGILMHDMYIEKATALAIAAPAAVATAGAFEKIITPTYHTHVERASMPRTPLTFRSKLPNMQPPRNDDRDDFQKKKLLLIGGSDAFSIWPSV